MAHTLKNRYRTRQMNERLQKADQRILAETRQVALILEAMNNHDLQTASTIIDKLRKVKGKGVKSLDAGIDTATTKLNKYTGGGPLTQAWTKLKSVVGFDNPLVQIMTFANALENGFRQMPTIIKNNVDAKLEDNLDKTLMQLVDDPAKQKTLAANMLKALSPQGIYSTFKKVPFVNRQALVNDLMSVPIKNFAAVAQAINSGPNTQSVAQDIKDTATQQGDVATKGTAGTEPAQPQTQTTGTAPAKGTAQTSPTAKTGEKPDRPPTQLADNIFKELSTSLIDAAGNEQRAKAILKLLADEGKLQA